MVRTANWVFTLNNYTDEHQQFLRDFASSSTVRYLVFGREVAPTTNTPHLQGFIQFNIRLRFATVRRSLQLRLPGIHIENARGTVTQALTYCKKDNDFEEFGAASDVRGPGHRTDREVFIDWCKQLDYRPNADDIARLFPGIWLQSGRRALDIALAHAPPTLLQDGDYRIGWQSELLHTLANDPVDDRQITFYVDIDGGKGKSWFVRKYLSSHDDAQIIGIGKRDDVAHAIDEKKRVFFVMVPRTQMAFVNMSVLEMIKDRMIFSPKYNSQTKILEHNPHVIVFTNERPNMDALTGDRYNIIEL